jgi:hypothetical protein
MRYGKKKGDMVSKIKEVDIRIKVDMRLLDEQIDDLKYIERSGSVHPGSMGSIRGALNILLEIRKSTNKKVK